MEIGRDPNRSLLRPEGIFPKEEGTGWNTTDGIEGVQATQWKPSADLESFGVGPSDFPHPWQANQSMQREFSSMIGGYQAPPLAVFPAPAQALNCVYSPPFPLPSSLIQSCTMAGNSPSYDPSCSAFDSSLPFRSSSNFISTESFDSFTSFGHFASVGSQETPSGFSDASSGIIPSFDSSLPYVPTPIGLDGGVEHPDLMPFTYYHDDRCMEEGLPCSQNRPVQYTSRPPGQLKCRQGPERFSSHGHASRESQTRPLRVTAEPTTKPKKVLKKYYECYPCRRGFERHEHLTRHKLTETHRKTLKDRGIPCFDPLPQMVACPFCSKKFNRRDNLKPHLFTHMHLAGENRRGIPVSIEESVRKGQAAIDPRLKHLSDAKRVNKNARIRSRARL